MLAGADQADLELELAGGGLGRADPLEGHPAAVAPGARVAERRLHGRGERGAVDADAVLDLDDEALQRTGAVDLRRAVDHGQRAVADLDVGLLARRPGERCSARRRPRPGRSARSRPSGRTSTWPARVATAALRWRRPRSACRVRTGEVDQDGDRRDRQQGDGVGAPAVPADEAADPAGPAADGDRLARRDRRPRPGDERAGARGPRAGPGVHTATVRRASSHLPHSCSSSVHGRQRVSVSRSVACRAAAWGYRHVAASPCGRERLDHAEHRAGRRLGCLEHRHVPHAVEHEQPRIGNGGREPRREGRVDEPVLAAPDHQRRRASARARPARRWPRRPSGRR